MHFRLLYSKKLLKSIEVWRLGVSYFIDHNLSVVLFIFYEVWAHTFKVMWAISLRCTHRSLTNKTIQKLYFFGKNRLRLARVTAKYRLSRCYEPQCHAMKVFTVPRMTFRQIGQSVRDLAHDSQHDKCPQGRKTVLISWSMQTLHVLASFNLRFSSSNFSASSLAIRSLSGFWVIDVCNAAEAGSSVGILSSAAHQR